MFNEGDRVVFYDNSRTGYSVGPSNPLVGSDWECEGTVVGQRNPPHNVQVQWDNGRYNVYKAVALQLIMSSAKNPNVAYKIAKSKRS